MAKPMLWIESVNCSLYSNLSVINQMVWKYTFSMLCCIVLLSTDSLPLRLSPTLEAVPGRWDFLPHPGQLFAPGDLFWPVTVWVEVWCPWGQNH